MIANNLLRSINNKFTLLTTIANSIRMSSSQIIDQPLPTIHTICRNTAVPYRGSKNIFRQPIPDDKVKWNVPFVEYAPADYTAESIIGKPWADPVDLHGLHWNSIDANDIDRRSFTGEYDTSTDGRPQNPVGRTGLRGRGVLGRWGPNHAADPIVTRWKRDSQRVLQFVAIQRQDNGEWAIPGGMIDAGERATTTLKREFVEEALDGGTISDIAELFDDLNAIAIYRGYVDDPRNTDNAWMETTAVNYHDASGALVGALALKAGSDAGAVRWMDVSEELRLYASHRAIMHAVAMVHSAEW